MFRSPALAGEIFSHYLFLDRPSTYFRPVQNLTYLLNYLWVGENLWWYHLTNIVLHGGVGIGLALVVWDIGRKWHQDAEEKLARNIGMGVGIIWVLHPIHNAIVGYISGRADALAFLFALGVYGGLVEWRREGKGIGRKWIWGCVVMLCGVLSILSKELGGMKVEWGERGILFVRSWGDYLGLIVAPLRLQMERVVYIPDAILGGKTDGYGYLTVLGLTGMVCMLGSWFWKAKGMEWRRLGIVWWCVGYLPVSNLIPLNAQVAEHWIYAASVGWLLWGVGVGMALFGNSKTLQTCALGVVLVWTGALGIRTWYRADDWGQAEEFFKRTMESGGGSPRILYNLAMKAMADGELEVAKALVEESLLQAPNTANSYLLAASYYIQANDALKAIALLEECPRNSYMEWKRKWLWVQLKAFQKEEMLPEVEELSQEYPTLWELQEQIVQWLIREGKAEIAEKGLIQYLEHRPWHYAAWMKLAEVSAVLEKEEMMVFCWKEAKQLDVWAYQPDLFLGKYYRLAQEEPLARVHFEEALLRVKGGGVPEREAEVLEQIKNKK